MFDSKRKYNNEGKHLLCSSIAEQSQITSQHRRYQGKMTVTHSQDAIPVGDGEESLSIGRLALRLRLRKHAIYTIKNCTSLR